MQTSSGPAAYYTSQRKNAKQEQMFKLGFCSSGTDAVVNETVRKMILTKLVKAGHQVTPDALEYISNSEDPLLMADQVIRMATDARIAVITRETLEGSRAPMPRSDTSQLDSSRSPPSDEGQDRGKQSDISRNLQLRMDSVVVLDSPTDQSVGSGGELVDFWSLFTDRFTRIRRMYKNRVDTANAITPAAVAKRYKSNTGRIRRSRSEGGRAQTAPPQVVLGMVKERSVSHSRNVVVELEGFERRDRGDSSVSRSGFLIEEYGTITCIIPSGRTGQAGLALAEKGNALLLDEVVCISGRIDEDQRLIADDVIFPEVPTSRKVGRAGRDVYAVFISDMHCGSREFLEDDFERFIAWMNGRGVEEEKKDLVRQIGYLLIAGDLCDGVGVYPDQKEHLAVSSIYEQYSYIAEKLKKLPESVTTLCIPGNHDACRQALPRPPIPPEFADALYSMGNRIVMLGDPTHVLIEGVHVLMTHGDALDDLVTQMPGVSYEKPEIGMKELLRKRHLAPIYGGKTELAPLSRDWLVIDDVPDIIHFGHAHHNAVDNYRGVQIINSGTFQAQTEFMRKQGVKPTPGIVTLINLRTGAPEVELFHAF